MPTYVPPKKNTQLIFYDALVQQADTRLLKSSPTIAAGDFKVSLDGAAFANLGTLPTVTPSSSPAVKFTLATTETNGDNALVLCSDAAGAEWCDKVILVQTAARQIEDLAFPATSGRSIVVDAAGLVDANGVKLGPTGAGTAQTARDIGASVLLSAGTGAGQLDFTAGVVKSNLVQILATALTETAGQIAGAFKQFFNIASPSSTVNLITSVSNLTNAPTAGDFTAAMKTSLNASTPASVGTVTGNVNGSVNSVTTDVGITQAAADKVWGTTVRSITDKAGFSLSSAGIQAIYDFATSLLTTLGSIGKLFVTNLDTNIGSRLATSGYTVPPDVNTIADGLLDRTNGVETGWTVRQILRILGASAGGDRSGFSTNSPTITNVTKAKARISSINADVDGNATTVLDNT